LPSGRFNASASSKYIADNDGTALLAI
jgi:hypothetical protein